MYRLSISIHKNYATPLMHWQKIQQLHFAVFLSAGKSNTPAGSLPCIGAASNSSPLPPNTPTCGGGRLGGLSRLAMLEMTASCWRHGPQKRMRSALTRAYTFSLLGIKAPLKQQAGCVWLLCVGKCGRSLVL